MSAVPVRRPRPGTLAHEAFFGWHESAAGRRADPALFFAPDGERLPARLVREAEAVKVCHVCPVRVECLEYALAMGIEHGVWGGLNEDERKAEQRRRAAEVAS